MPRLTFTFQEASPLITYTGFWTEGSPQNDTKWESYDGSFRVTNSTGAKASFNFIGTAVSIFGALRPNHGDYAVDLDHTTMEPGARGSRPDAFKQTLWSASELINVEHTVDVTNKPTSVDQSYFDVDSVSIEREIGQDSDTIHNSTLDDTSSFVQYTGPWDSSTVMQNRNHNGTVHQTAAANSELVIVFQGCCIELYGLYANADYTVGLDMELPVQMRGMEIGLESDMWHPQTLLYLRDGLSETTNHTLTLRTTNANKLRPFFFDYAVVRSTNKFTSSASPYAISNRPSTGKATPVGLIAGVSVGGVVLIVLMVTVYLLIRRRWKGNLSRDTLAESDDMATSAPNHRVSFSRILPTSVPPSSVISPWRPAPGDIQNPRMGIKSSQVHSGVEATSSTNTSPNPLPSLGPSTSQNQEREPTSATNTSLVQHSRQTRDDTSQLQIQTEDGGVVIEEMPMTLPPAYDPAWDQSRR